MSDPFSMQSYKGWLTTWQLSPIFGKEKMWDGKPNYDTLSSKSPSTSGLGNSPGVIGSGELDRVYEVSLHSLSYSVLLPSYHIQTSIFMVTPSADCFPPVR